jgi:hypothetical protein
VHNLCAKPVRAFARFSTYSDLIERPRAAATEHAAQNGRVMPGWYLAKSFEQIGISCEYAGDSPREQQTPEALGAYHKTEIERLWPIIKAAGIKGRLKNMAI